MRTYRSWRGLKSLVHDAVSATTDLVGLGHDSTGRTTERIASVTPLGPGVRVVNALRKLATDSVLVTVKGVNRLVEGASDVALDAALGTATNAEPDHPVTMRSDALGTGAWVGDALIGAVNGVVGDHLHQRGNGLGLGMSLRSRDLVLTPATLPILPDPTRRVAVWVHGLATTEWSWCLDTARFLGDPAANFGTLLERDLGFTPVYARYNTGRSVVDNGRDLATQLQALVDSWPGGVDEIVLIGHSMGGLVSRSAAHLARAEGHRWLDAVTRIVCLGTPHQGAPLERFGVVVADALGAIDLPGTRIPAAILRARSAGIQDLGHGEATPDIQLGNGDLLQISVPSGVAWAFIAGSLTADPEHPVSRMFGDLLVQVPSAEGPINARFPVQTARFGGVRHHELQVHPDVYEQVRKFCAGEWEKAGRDLLG